MSKEDTITHTTITKGAIIPSTPHKISTHLKTAITLLVMAFLLLAPTTTTYAKRVKIQSNLYQHELQRRIKDPFLINIVKRATTGKAGYLGEYKEIRPIVEKINQRVGTHLMTWKRIEKGRELSYYNQFLELQNTRYSNEELTQRDGITHMIYYVSITDRKGNTSKERKRYWTLAKKAVRKAGVHNGDSDKEAVRKISKWICKHTKYKAGTYDNSEDYTLFSKGTGVCRDYSDAFWAMCKVCNIPCEYYTGRAGGAHGWNRVKVSGKWYWIDVTWMDGKTIEKKYYLKRKLWKNHKDAKPCTKSILCSRVKYYWEHP